MDVETLLGRGYFPVELPPPFTTSNFAAVSSKLATRKKKWTEPARFNLARVGGLRRALSIPNPESQLALAKVVVGAWADLDAHYSDSPFSLSRPVEDKSGQRAFVSRASLADRPAFRSRRMHTARFTLQSDVSQCYASIYTHSLSWALHGKATAKSRMGDLTLNGNSLDKAVRDGQSGQTKGLPIGPDTSLVLAELILCAIDRELQGKVANLDTCGLRYLDDLEIFTRTRGEAEGALLAWESALGRYELLINPEKTLIAEGPVGLDTSWRTRLRQFAIRTESERRAANDIVAFFDLAFELARETPREAVISWAVQRFRDFPFGDETWRAFSDLLLPAAIAEPSCLRYVSRALADGRTAGRKPNITRLSRTMNALVEHHAPLEHGAEVAWALWILCENDGKLDAEATRAVASMADNASLILLLHLLDRHLADASSADLSAIENACRATNALEGTDWLLAYESARHGWTSDSTVQGDPFFRRLLKLGVKFFDPGDVARLAKAPTTTPGVEPSSGKPSKGTDEPDLRGESSHESAEGLADGSADQPVAGLDASARGDGAEAPEKGDADVVSPKVTSDDDPTDSDTEAEADSEGVFPVPSIDGSY